MVPTYFVGTQRINLFIVCRGRRFFLFQIDPLPENLLIGPKIKGSMMRDLKAEKTLLRQAALQARNQLAEDFREKSAHLLIRHLDQAAILPAAGIVAGFWPIRSEMDVRPLMDILAARGYQLCLPAVLDGQRIEFRSMSFADPLVETGFGTYGPPANAPVVEPDVMLVPLAAFDRFGQRIGYGAGYYDRAIAAYHDKNKFPLLIGVAFDAQRVDQIAQEPHDVALNYILTETGLIAAQSG